MASLSHAELSLVKCRAPCRKQVVHRLLVERVEKRRPCYPTSVTAPPKVGQPSVSDDRGHPQRGCGVKPKDFIFLLSMRG